MQNSRTRLGILGVVALGLFAAMFTRLWYLQVLSEKEFEVYAIYAGTLLVARHPDRAFALFFRQTPRVGWEKAFELAFGQSVEEFYAGFGK